MDDLFNQSNLPKDVDSSIKDEILNEIQKFQLFKNKI
jgi:hypothetical protein